MQFLDALTRTRLLSNQSGRSDDGHDPDGCKAADGKVPHGSPLGVESCADFEISSCRNDRTRNFYYMHLGAYPAVHVRNLGVTGHYNSGGLTVSIWALFGYGAVAV
jgi:hypothetical protein